MGSISVTNKYQFISLEGFEGLWSLTENGIEIDKGTFRMPRVGPRRSAGTFIPYKIEHPKAGAEYFLRVSYVQKSKTLWADKGYEVAWDQFKLPVKTLPVEEPKITQTVKLSQDAQKIKVAGNGFSVAFDKKSGKLVEIEKNGVNILTSDGSPKLHLYRSPHQTDDSWADRIWSKFGVKELLTV
jgi:beta-galactosidase